MANISTLTVSLVAETAQFENGLKKSRREADKFGAALKKTAAVGAAAIGALAVGMGALVKRSLEVVDAQTEAARALGTNQRVYSGLTLAAELYGIEITGIEKALKRQLKSISDANDGLSTQKRAFDKLGLSVDALLKMPMEKQFVAITSALSNIENDTIRVAAATDIYGAKNAALIASIDAGAEGFDDLLQKVQDFGVALSDEQIANIGEFDDAMILLRTSVTGLGNQLAALLAPALTKAAQILTSFVSTITNSIPKFTAWAAAILGVERNLNALSVAELNAEINQLESDLLDASNRWLELSNRIGKGFSASEINFGVDAAVRKEFADTEAAMEAMIARLEEAKRARDELANRGSDVTLPSGGGGSSLDPFNLAELDAGLSDTKQRLDALLSQTQEWERQAANLFDNTRTPIERFNEELKSILENPFIDEDLQQRAIDDAIARLHQAMEDAKKEVDEGTSKLSEFAIEGFRSMQSALSDFLFEPWEDGLDGMAKGFGRVLRRMVADLVASKLLETFFGLLGKFFGFDPKAILGKRAIGGTVSAGQSVVVGERGRPEVFTPGAGGAVRPLSPASFTFQTNIGGTGDGLTLRTLIPILDQRDRALKADILDMFDRGAFA